MGKLEILTIPAMLQASFKDYANYQSLIFAGAIRGTGYVVDSLGAALWATDRSHDFRSAVLAAVNLGDDADTTGAITGQLAGAIYGEDSIPPDLRQSLAHPQLLNDYAERLCKL